MNSTNTLLKFSLRNAPRLVISPLSQRSVKRFSSKAGKIPHTSWSTKSKCVLAGCLALSSFAALNYQSINNDQNIKDDAENSVRVDKSVSPFPTKLAPPEFPLTTSYTLLGYGTRSVTFVGFKVYALGIYSADLDLQLIPTVLDSKFLSTAFIDTDPSKPHSENVQTALNDPIKSRILIGNLLDSGIRMVAKITPIRNTDFNHLKDGLVKSIMGHPDANANQECLSKGLKELKEAFTRKGSVPKDDDLIIELQANSGLQLYYYNRKKNDFVSLGQVSEPIIGKFLFSQYLSGPKPLSPNTKESVASKITTLV